MKQLLKQLLTPVLNFAIHSIVGAMLFMAIGVPAVLLNEFVKYLDNRGTSAFVCTTLSWLEHGILALDAFAVAVYLIVNTIHELREMVKSKEKSDELPR